MRDAWCVRVQETNGPLPERFCVLLAASTLNSAEDDGGDGGDGVRDGWRFSEATAAAYDPHGFTSWWASGAASISSSPYAMLWNATRWRRRISSSSARKVHTISLRLVAPANSSEKRSRPRAERRRRRCSIFSLTVHLSSKMSRKSSRRLTRLRIVLTALMRSNRPTCGGFAGGAVSNDGLQGRRGKMFSCRASSVWSCAAASLNFLYSTSWRMSSQRGSSESSSPSGVTC